jgi:hypothetical protein
MNNPKPCAAIIVVCLLAWIPCAGAAERTEADFVKACTASSNLSAAICACSAAKAKAELTADGFALLLATLEGDDKTAAELRSRLPLEQVMKAGTFMTRGPAQCARE